MLHLLSCARKRWGSMGKEWDRPSLRDVNEVVSLLGGISSVCRITKKHRNTVSKWCSGKIKIDYANWDMLNRISGKA